MPFLLIMYLLEKTRLFQFFITFYCTLYSFRFFWKCNHYCIISWLPSSVMPFRCTLKSFLHTRDLRTPKRSLFLSWLVFTVLSADFCTVWLFQHLSFKVLLIPCIICFKWEIYKLPMLAQLLGIASLEPLFHNWI